MQNITASKLIAYAIAITSIFFVTSCINNVDNSRPTRYQVGMEIQNIDSSFTVGSDSMNVESVRFIVGAFNFQTADTTLPLKDNTGVPLSFDSRTPNFQNPAVISGGNFPPNTYQSLNITFPKAPENSSTNIGPDFYDNGKRYSIIAEGTFNDSEFTYKSERPVVNSFSLNVGEVLEDNQIFTFLIQTDLRNWFLDENGQGLINPTNPENSNAINNNIGADATFQFEENSSVLN